MSLEMTSWTNAVWALLRELPTGGCGEEFEAAWSAHQARRQPVAAIYGAYDGGKSSLLKRLLFEDGVPVPPVVTVSGRRETFSVDEVAGVSWTFRDSPGLAGGNDEHDQKALESLDLADLLVWVLPPQLVTDGKEIFDTIVTGTRFNVTGEHCARSMIAVISRIDEAGIDHSDNPAGFRDLCERKKVELHDLLAAVEAPHPRWGVHAVSADPYQGVGNEPPAADIYQMGEGWDGVPSLREALAEASRHAGELRTLAGYRFASRAASVLVRHIKSERERREVAIVTADNELERLGLWRMSLDAVRRKCAADLHRMLEDELLSASRIGTAEAAASLRGRLEETIDRWSAQAYADFEQLARSADQEAGERSRGPAMDHLRKLISQQGEEETGPRKPREHEKWTRRTSTLGRGFRDGFKSFARVDMGMSLDEASKLLREFNESGKTWSAFRKAKKGRTFASEAVAKKASKYVKWADALDSFGPVLEQLGPLLFDVGRDVLSAIEAKEKAERRRQLREALRAATRSVEEEAMTGFDEMVSDFGEWLDRQENFHQPTKQALTAQVAELTRYLNKLEALMRNRPTSVWNGVLPSRNR